MNTLTDSVSFDKQYSMVFYRVILSVWDEYRKQCLINSLKFFLNTVCIIITFAIFNDNSVTDWCIADPMLSFSVLTVPVFRFHNKSGLTYYMNEFVYWACSCVYMFYFMTHSVFTWSLHRFIWDTILYPKVVTISGFLEHK